MLVLAGHRRQVVRMDVVRQTQRPQLVLPIGQRRLVLLAGQLQPPLGRRDLFRRLAPLALDRQHPLQLRQVPLGMFAAATATEPSAIGNSRSSRGDLVVRFVNLLRHAAPSCRWQASSRSEAESSTKYLNSHAKIAPAMPSPANQPPNWPSIDVGTRYHAAIITKPITNTASSQLKSPIGTTCSSTSSCPWSLHFFGLLAGLFDPLFDLHPPPQPGHQVARLVDRPSAGPSLSPPVIADSICVR